MNDLKMYELDFTEPTVTSWALIRQTWTAMSKVAETKLAKVGLTPEMAAVLWLCRDYPGTLTPAEISRMVFREAQSTTGLLNRMERSGLIKRIPKRKGRPYTEVKITPKGEKACTPGVEVYKKLIQGLTSDLPTDEREQFHKTLRPLLLKMLNAMHLEIERPRSFPQDKPIPVKW